METRIRLCGEADLAALRHIALETYDETFRSMNVPETMDAYLSEAFAEGKLLAELRDAYSSFSFLHANNDLAGYLKCNHGPAQTDIKDPRSLEIERFYIRKAYQGRGLGTFLMNHALQAAVEAQSTYVWLGVWEKNLNAIAFYERMGFQADGRHAFRMGTELQSDLIMKKVL